MWCTFLKTTEIPFMLNQHFLEAVSTVFELQLLGHVSLMVIVGFIVTFNQSCFIILQQNWYSLDDFANTENSFQVIVDSLLNANTQYHSNFLVSEYLINEALILHLNVIRLLFQYTANLLKVSYQIIYK